MNDVHDEGRQWRSTRDPCLHALGVSVCRDGVEELSRGAISLSVFFFIVVFQVACLGRFFCRSSSAPAYQTVAARS